ncbi:hypothetical protein BLA24_00495 [Streptomyces cinnamoneus]|uniref:Knr4/Smi1-like domain-containing protein n=2 Tax=Streptomyces cinnamoneus TaxID=53446 RepID=A0A2G1XQS0_STRCJ|nr:hypothetical protein BLA24_00495 [Streptomyces cinnamoneus]PPT16412.1 hypothetical protein CYQ11_07505 [Streptomyces cinnamoneus]
MLGEATGHGANPGAWESIENSLGFGLPADYKQVLEAYGPVKLNGHLYVNHPATVRWNLGKWIRETVVAWGEVPWDDDIDGDPRPALGISEMKFGTSDGLTPIAGTDRGELIFLARGASGQEWRIFVGDGDGEFFEYSICFSEWLYRYLVGEDMAGPNSSAFYPGPVKFEGRPMSYGEETAVWYGPDRGM